MSSKNNFNPYQLENVPLYEALYGNYLISLGGIPSIENMFSDLNLHHLKALDIGFGLGGIPYYLAKQYAMTIYGIEIHRWMVDYAKSHAPKNIAQQLYFDVYDEKENIPFSDQKFDLIYSKGVLNHVQNKLPLFQQIYSYLKEGGYFVIADWIYSNADSKTNSPLVKESETSYRTILNKSGFQHVEFRNDSKQFENYVQLFLENLETQCEFITQHFGEELLIIIKDDHSQLLKEIQNNTKIAIRILAKKNV